MAGDRAGRSDRADSAMIHGKTTARYRAGEPPRDAEELERRKKQQKAAALVLRWALQWMTSSGQAAKEKESEVTSKRTLAAIKERLADAFSKGNHTAARESFLELLRAGKSWLLEVRESSDGSDEERAERFTDALESLERTLRRNDEIAAFAPFLIGERVEIEQIEYGPRYVWVEATIIDCRPAALRGSLHPRPRALDYLVRDEESAESWRAEEGIRKKIRR